MFAFGDVIAATTTNIALPLSSSWIFQIRLDGFGGSSVGELAISLNQGATSQFVRSTFVITPGIDYYVAAAVDIPAGIVTFYRKNLTTGAPLETFVASHARTALNNITAFQIGASPAGGFDFGFDGLVDEVRLSNTALGAGGLLVPEPSTFVLLAFGLGWMGLYRRRN